MVSTYVAYWAASWLTNVYGEVFVDNEIFFTLGILALVNVVILGAFHLYNHLWEYASIGEAFQIALSVILSTLTGAAFLWIIDVRLPIRVFVGACILLIFFVGGSRLAFRVSRRPRAGIAQRHEKRPRSLIVGAGETGSLTIQRMTKHDPLMPGIPIVATDDDPKKRKMRIHGVKVEGGSDDIVRLVERYGIEQIVVAIPSATVEERKRIYAICMKTDCKLKTLPNVRELRVDELDDIGLRDVDLADLLGRDEILLNTRAVSGHVAGKTVLVTGGGGSIGSELCRQICAVAPKRLVIFDIYENDAFLLANELREQYDDIEIIIEIGSVCDEARISDIFDKYHPAVVYHAAAHKHVPLMEVCPREALHNNVLGTLYTVRAADRVGVSRFTFISTDKAVNPTSVMGATKRIGEMIIQYYARESKTVFSAVRFGNVLGSHGSVIPIFQKQIASGGPVTVTDPNIERYFMTIPEAARLVIQASIMAGGGEIFILNMGEPVKILDLARNLIQLSGHEPDEDIKIVFTGLRPGEKMYEELLMAQETTLPTRDSRIMISVGEEVCYEEMTSKLDELSKAISGTDDEAIEAIGHAVPTYRHTVNESTGVKTSASEAREASAVPETGVAGEGDAEA